MPDPSTLVLTAATAWEARPLARALGLLPDGPALWRGSVGARRAVLVETGMGSASTAAALERVLGTANGGTPGLAVSTGLCGGLQPGIKSGDLVLDVHGAPLEFALAARPAAERVQVPLHIGAIADADHVLLPAEKRALGAKARAAGVDMESAAVRSWAAGRGSVFLAVRAVLDALEDSVPTLAPQDDTAFGLLRYAASHWAELPHLALTGLRAKRAIDGLGRFLAEYLGETNEHVPEA